MNSAIIYIVGIFTREDCYLVVEHTYLVPPECPMESYCLKAEHLPFFLKKERLFGIVPGNDEKQCVGYIKDSGNFPGSLRFGTGGRFYVGSKIDTNCRNLSKRFYLIHALILHEDLRDIRK